MLSWRPRHTPDCDPFSSFLAKQSFVRRYPRERGKPGVDRDPSLSLVEVGAKIPVEARSIKDSRGWCLRIEIQRMTVLAETLNVRPYGDDIPNIYDPASHRGRVEKFS